MHGQISNFISPYINWIVNNFNEISRVNLQAPSLKLVSYEKNEATGDIDFIVQISGKNLFPKLSTRDFVNDTSIIRSFCSSDQNVIRKLLPNHPSLITHKIICRTYDRATKKLIFTIEYIDNVGFKKRISTNDLRKLTKHLHLFDKEDALIIELEVEKQTL